MKPKVVIIHGAPAYGKTTLSHKLKLGLDDVILLNKDAIKEFLYDTQPAGDREWSRVLGKASVAAMYAMAEQFLASGKSVILESAFYAEHARDDLLAIDVPILELYCMCDETVRQDRFKTRASTTRHPGHIDGANLSTDITEYQPIGVGENIKVDTTYAITNQKLAEITHQITRFLKEED